MRAPTERLWAWLSFTIPKMHVAWCSKIIY